MAEELTSAQIEALRQDLQTLQQELETHIAAAGLGAETVHLDNPIGRLSRMDQLQQQQMNKEQIRRAEIRLAQTTTALSAIVDDDYGYCHRCDEPIGYARLKARPEARACVNCQNELE